jgi:phosphoenolpyruvate---glycerone phosphotransferase subunit DhaL
VLFFNLNLAEQAKIISICKFCHCISQKYLTNVTFNTILQLQKNKGMIMTITKTVLSNMLLTSCAFLMAEADKLSEIDSRFGDGDHGVTIKKIAGVISVAVNSWEDQSIKNFLDDLGAKVMGIGGGSAGPLWGTMINGLALPLNQDSVEIDPVMLKAILNSALEELKTISTAGVGDKTMMDVLIPAVLAAQNAPNDIRAILDAAAAAAVQGAKDTENYIAKFGRAKSYKEQTIGTADAGALSLMVFFKGLASGARESLPFQ